MECLQNILNELPPEFIQFLESQSIDLNLLQQPSSRYIRIKPSSDVSLQQLQELSADISPVAWIQNLYSLSASVKISQNVLYNNGVLYGIDMSSAAVVQALNIGSDDYRVLEICCAPGAKLSYIADLLQQQTNPGIRKIVGVDINQNRLNITKSLLVKYNLLDMTELVLADGTKYQSDELFDKVLVDAECTHEGSIKHLMKFTRAQTQKPNQASKKSNRSQKQSQKQLKANHSNQYLSSYDQKNQWSQQDFMDRFLDPLKLKNIVELQLGLLRQGFKLLRNGGQLIYSTCSFTYKQNEGVVSSFMEEIGEMGQQIHPFDHIPVEERSRIPYRVGQLENTVRFDPVTSNSGGIFIAKILKF